MRRNDLNNRHSDFCESRIRACPESVGVGKFCRLRLQLRLRERQPTPTDSDSGSDSDSAALVQVTNMPESTGRTWTVVAPFDLAYHLALFQFPGWRLDYLRSLPSDFCYTTAWSHQAKTCWLCWSIHCTHFDLFESTWAITDLALRSNFHIDHKIYSVAFKGHRGHTKSPYFNSWWNHICWMEWCLICQDPPSCSLDVDWLQQAKSILWHWFSQRSPRVTTYISNGWWNRMRWMEYNMTYNFA